MEACSISGYSSLEISEIVERELKSPQLLTEMEMKFLDEHVSLWKSELIDMKKRTEMQLTSNSARMYNLYVQYINKDLTHQTYIGSLNERRIWKVNATRFLQQLEHRIQRLKISKL